MSHPHITVIVLFSGKEFSALLSAEPTSTMRQLVEAVLLQHGLSLQAPHSTVRYEGRVVHLEELLSVAVPDLATRTSITLQVVETAEQPADSDMEEELSLDLSSDFDLASSATSADAAEDVIDLDADPLEARPAASARHEADSGLDLLSEGSAVEETVAFEPPAAAADSSSIDLGGLVIEPAAEEGPPASGVPGIFEEEPVAVPESPPAATEESLFDTAALEEVTSSPPPGLAAEDDINIDDILHEETATRSREQEEVQYEHDVQEETVADMEAGAIEEEEAEEAAPTQAPRRRAAVAAPQARAEVERHANVRYYSQMNPERSYPLLVVLSAEAQAQLRTGKVQQRSGASFRVQQGSFVDIEPLLPGCTCYPTRERVQIGSGEVSVTFWVVPYVLGRVNGARILVRQQGRVLSDIPLDVRVVKQTAALLAGACSLVLPFASSALRHYRLDFDSQLDDGFASYVSLGGHALASLSPWALLAGLLTLTALAYLWFRPRKRHEFWDLVPGQAPSLMGRRAVRSALPRVGWVAFGGAASGLLLGLLLLVVAAVAGSVTASKAGILVGGLGGVGAVVGVLAGVLGDVIDSAAGDEGT